MEDWRGYWWRGLEWWKGFLGGSDGENLPAVQKTWVPALGWKDPLEKGFQHSCLEDSLDRGARWATVHGSQRAVHDWANNSLEWWKGTLLIVRGLWRCLDGFIPLLTAQIQYWVGSMRQSTGRSGKYWFLPPRYNYPFWVIRYLCAWKN